jgi:hypothetical protein
MAWHPTEDTRVIAPKLLARKEASFPEKEVLFIRTILESVPPEAAEPLTLDHLRDFQESSRNGLPAIAGVESWSEPSLNFHHVCRVMQWHQKPLSADG